VTHTLPAASWVIGRDESSDDFSAFYFDNRAVSRIYGMSLKDRVWKLWRTTPESSQRFEAGISDDGQTITGAWQKSLDGDVWEHDFNLKYTKRR
jgi:hypothetical protein